MPVRLLCHKCEVINSFTRFTRCRSFFSGPQNSVEAVRASSSLRNWHPKVQLIKRFKYSFNEIVAGDDGGGGGGGRIFPFWYRARCRFQFHVLGLPFWDVAKLNEMNKCFGDLRPAIPETAAVSPFCGLYLDWLILLVDAFGRHLREICFRDSASAMRFE